MSIPLNSETENFLMIWSHDSTSSSDFFVPLNSDRNEEESEFLTAFQSCHAYQYLTNLFDAFDTYPVAR